MFICPGTENNAYQILLPQEADPFPFAKLFQTSLRAIQDREEGRVLTYGVLESRKGYRYWLVWCEKGVFCLLVCIKVIQQTEAYSKAAD